jgi:aminoglycoside 3-N-acetyltransferase
VLFRLLELSPYIEVIVRRIYWSSPRLVEAFANKTRREQPARLSTTGTMDKIELFMRNHGVCKGSLLVVHSSARALSSTGYSASGIIDRLISLIGSEGTLAMPAFPRYDGEPKGIDRMRADVSDIELVYDVKRSVPWTGAIPFTLMRRQDAKRSHHPLNTMVAVGPMATEMMENNLAGDRPLPCGPNSAWKFCADHKAIVVALGVDMAHSLTMIHVAEDSYQQEWPVNEWYRERRFRVVDQGVGTRIVVRERHPKWAMYFAERTLSKDLKKAGLLASTTIDGILVEVIAAEELIHFLNQRKSSAYPYYMLPGGIKKCN